MKERNYTFTSKKIGLPLPTYYSPELDGSKELDPEQANHHQSFIGILRWIVGLGQIDIGYEASVMASHAA